MLLELLFTNLLMFLGMHDFILIKRRRIGCINHHSHAASHLQPAHARAPALRLSLSFGSLLQVRSTCRTWPRSCSRSKRGEHPSWTAAGAHGGRLNARGPSGRPDGIYGEQHLRGR